MIKANCGKCGNGPIYSQKEDPKEVLCHKCFSSIIGKIKEDHRNMLKVVQCKWCTKFFRLSELKDQQCLRTAKFLSFCQNCQDSLFA